MPGQEKSSLQNPLELLPKRDPYGVSDGFMTVYDSTGSPHKKPRIVAKECLRQKGWTADSEVAAARRAAKSDEAQSKPKKSGATEVRQRDDGIKAREEALAARGETPKTTKTKTKAKEPTQ